MIKTLIVDDEQRMLDLIALYLKPEGFHCEQATSGKEAIKQVRHTTYDVILLDIMMPERVAGRFVSLYGKPPRYLSS